MRLKKILKVSECFALFVVFAGLILLIFAPDVPVRAAAGDLDPTFGSGGKLLLPEPDGFNAVLVQPDGKILSLGSDYPDSSFSLLSSTWLMRLNSDGTFDDSFGEGGIVRPHVRQHIVSTLRFTLQPDGKIVLLGVVRVTQTSPHILTVLRYHPNGQPDLNFGSGGSVTVPAVQTVSTVRVIIQPDGKILVCSLFRAIFVDPLNEYYVLLRFNQDGTFDTSFGNNGIVPPESAFDLRTTPSALLLQDDNKILVCGTNWNQAGFAVVRYHADGALDTSFGTRGKTVIRSEWYDRLYDAALQKDGKIVLTGVFRYDNYTTVMLARLTRNGQPDSSFGTGGKVLRLLNEDASSESTSVLIQPNGKILICGFVDVFGTGRVSLVARYDSSGRLDTSFGRGRGYVSTAFIPFTFLTVVTANDMAFQPDGRLVVVGYMRNSNSPINATIARYQINDADYDFDGDGKADLSFFRPNAQAEWHWTGSANNQSGSLQFGFGTDKPAPADFDGDGKTDVSVFRPADGGWYRLNSSNNTFTALQFGASGDLPVPGDYDGDAKADICVYRPSAGSWYRLNSSNNRFVAAQFGIAEDKPLMGDFDGDGISDLVVFRPSNSTWYRINSSNQTFSANQFGISADKPVAADYDGDGKTDLAVFRPSAGNWYVINSGNKTLRATDFGEPGDKPSPADFDGDGKTDLAVFKPASGSWYLLRTTDGFASIQFGAAGDIPAPNAFVR